MIQRLKDWGKLANALTIGRLVLSPIVLAILSLNPHDPIIRIWATVAFVVVMLTDALDGIIARKWNQISDFGKLWDPVADKVFVVLTTLSVCMFSIVPELWGWLYFIFTVIREGGMIWWRQLKAPQLIIAANWTGKWKTITLSVALFMILLPPVDLWLHPMAVVWWNTALILLLGVSLLCSIVSGVQYYLIGSKQAAQ
ncbi:MAG: CDP-alcohol phosphatidyltransferase family protein [Candidatus Saccharimonas sp.]